ncbi:pantoate--beta-alanine ligase [uncultured Cyclobacterium sp.]|uniref:pantoate--beta-alanine ligase n=1 Tax=uncultured Cyclobacterium sp. TaxID=453820 RepID=UPI0030EBEE6D
MEILKTISSVKQHLRTLKTQNRAVGLVPTMGALHQGHLELIRQSKKQTDITFVSIFVNPIQFNNPEDLQKYPRTLSSDLEILANEGVDMVFTPSESEMYPHAVMMEFDFGSMEQVLEGRFRPGHFNGVAIVVSKLFHILQPDISFFGQKDIQQVAVIQRMVNDLSYPIKIEVVPTMREADGLAMSSRNQRLSKEGRALASILYKVLSKCKDELLRGEQWLHIKNKVIQEMLEPLDIKSEYLELVELSSFSPVNNLTPEKPYAVCIAAHIEEVRLIDNIIIRTDHI